MRTLAVRTVNQFSSSQLELHVFRLKKNEEAKQVCEDGLRWNNSPRKDTDFLDTAGNIFAFINLKVETF